MDKMSSVILAGGKGKRMGFLDKGLLRIKNDSFIDIIYRNLSFTNETIIVTNSKENYNFKKYKLYEDIVSGKGPLGGIYTGLEYSSNEKVLFIPCDMPSVKKRTLELISNIAFNEDALVVVNRNQIQPLIGIYRKSINSVIYEMIETSNEVNGNLSIRNLLSRISVKYIYLNHETNEFININTPDIYKNLKNLQII